MKNHSILWLMLFISLSIINPIKSNGYDESAATITKLSQEIQKANGKDKAELLLKRGEAYRSLGYYPDAKDDFTAALETTKTIKPSASLLEIVALQSLGYIHFLMQDTKKAEVLLRSALEKADKLSPPSPTLSASCANHLGNVLAGQNRKEEALQSYQMALGYLNDTIDFGLKATIHRNIAGILTDKESAFKHLDTAKSLTTRVISLHEKARLMLDIAAEYGIKEPGSDGDSFRYPLLAQALAIALNLKDQRLISLASGQLGALYESRSRIPEAITFTGQAVESALIVQSHDLLVQWEWQWGRLLKRQAEERNEVGHQKAIAAYQRALFHVAAIRQDMPVIDSKGCSSFKMTLSPIYTDLADMLLKESGVVKEKQEQQRLLRQAQQALESIKQSELQDYFKDPCIDAIKHEIQSLSPSTAVIYPVILPDRLELLADIGGTLYRKTTDIKKDELEQTITLLASNLRNGLFYEELGKKVYGWLVFPVESILDGQHVDTLIIVPDGVFRMIPVAALWNGQEFLGQKYAVVTEPALTLLDPSALPKGERNTLLAGMSKPGPVVLDLPNNMWNQLSRATMSKENLSIASRGIRGLSIKQAAPAPEDISDTQENVIQKQNATATKGNTKENQTTATQRNKETVEQVKQMLALPGVDKEIENLSKNLNSHTLMNSDFLRERFSGEIKNQNYRIVHVASHGFFGGSPEENFIMTYDKILNMNLLEEYIKPKQFADLPVELLTLSACQTAEGDDRSPLGLSGVALKSGARSVLGSLWPVSDTATQLLLSSFYKYLNSSDISKAKALQKAQLELIKTKEFNHPFYWSAFILVGNWL